MKTRGRENVWANTALVYVLVFSLAYSPFFIPSASAVTGVPKIINYQGRLANGDGDLLGGSSGTAYYFKFSIWDSPTSTPVTGTQLWPSASSSVTTSTVTSGVFNVAIGDTDNGYPDALTYDFYENRDVYLQVEVSSNGTSFETLSPRQRIGASGFAVSAETVTGKLYASSTADYTFDVINDGSGRANLSAEGQVRVGNFTAAPTTIGDGSLYYNSGGGPPESGSQGGGGPGGGDSGDPGGGSEGGGGEGGGEGGSAFLTPANHSLLASIQYAMKGLVNTIISYLGTSTSR